MIVGFPTPDALTDVIMTSLVPIVVVVAVALSVQVFVTLSFVEYSIEAFVIDNEPFCVLIVKLLDTSVPLPFLITTPESVFVPFDTPGPISPVQVNVTVWLEGNEPDFNVAVLLAVNLEPLYTFDSSFAL